MYLVRRDDSGNHIRIFLTLGYFLECLDEEMKARVNRQHGTEILKLQYVSKSPSAGDS